MIALLCPSRARPDQCKSMIESVYATSSTNPEIYISTDAMDLWAYKEARGIYATDWIHLPHGLPTSHKWNILAERALENPQTKLFMLAADDMGFLTTGWDVALLEHYNALDKKQHVYALQDSRDNEGTPHIIVTREWIETMGWFVPPLFLHWYIDSWSVEIAKSAGCFTHLKQFTLAHDKPSDEGMPDETFSLIRSYGWRERDQYVAETCKDWLELQKAKLMQATGWIKVDTRVDKYA